MICLASPAIRLYVGGHASTVQGEVQNLTGYRCFTAARRPQVCRMDVNEIEGLLDSGAFSDAPESRLTPDQALARQLRWEDQASSKWGGRWQAAGLVSYDRLIDETWIDGARHKRRWSVADADKAVAETVEAARFLASRRRELWPRQLFLACQGVDAGQYRDCVAEVLKVANPDDCLGFGGWCILGRYKRLLPEFFKTLDLSLPLIARAGLTRVHIFGVLWEPALAGMLWLADEYGLSVSTDSSAPILACTWKNQAKAGVRVACGRWRCNVGWWRRHLAGLRESRFYRNPLNRSSEQISFFDRSYEEKALHPARLPSAA